MNSSDCLQEREGEGMLNQNHVEELSLQKVMFEIRNDGYKGNTCQVIVGRIQIRIEHSVAYKEDANAIYVRMSKYFQPIFESKGSKFIVKKNEFKQDGLRLGRGVGSETLSRYTVKEKEDHTFRF